MSVDRARKDAAAALARLKNDLEEERARWTPGTVEKYPGTLARLRFVDVDVLVSELEAARKADGRGNSPQSREDGMGDAAPACESCAEQKRFADAAFKEAERYLQLSKVCDEMRAAAEAELEAAQERTRELEEALQNILTFCETDHRREIVDYLPYCTVEELARDALAAVSGGRRTAR